MTAADQIDKELKTVLNRPLPIKHASPLKWSWIGAWGLLVPLALGGPTDPSRLDKTVETTVNPRISVSNLKGHVTVKGWDRSEVHVTSTSASPEIEVDMEQFPPTGPAEKIHFTTHFLNPQTNDKSTDYTLEVPLGSSLEVRNPEGSVQIQTLRGEASVNTVGATIAVSDVSGHLEATTIGGDVEIVRPSGRVEANSICGSLRVVNPASSRLRVVTTSGKIFYEGDFLPGGDYELSDYSGDVEILTPQSASFELIAKTVRGKVIADPEMEVTPKRHTAFRSPYGANSLFGTHNAGKATLKLNSFSSTIRIRRLP